MAARLKPQTGLSSSKAFATPQSAFRPRLLPSRASREQALGHSSASLGGWDMHAECLKEEQKTGAQKAALRPFY